MHVLLTNDDGPIDDNACPYMKYFVDEIKQATDWDISIVIPNQQRSWIGKAHFAGKTLVATYIYTKNSTSTPNDQINAYEGPFDHPIAKYNDDPEYQEWCLINSTPAACADIGIHHLYRHSKNKPVDLVISGPNFGKNSSNLYILASGTVGAAMEAVTHGVKAIGLSYAFNNLDHDFYILKKAAQISVKLIERLYVQLQQNKDVDLFSVNVPLVPSLDLEKTRIQYAPIFKNTWKSIYAPKPEPNDKGQLEFYWAPDFKQVYKDGLEDHTHTDSRVLLNEGISVTPLKACFQTVDALVGKINLNDETNTPLSNPRGTSTGFEKNTFLITIPKDSYLYEPLVEPFKQLGYTISTDPKVIDDIGKNGKKDDDAVNDEKQSESLDQRVFHYGEYEDIDLDKLDNKNYFIPSYIYRKALIRKHYLANTVHHYITKHPESILKKAVPENYQLELDYAEFLDDSLDDSYELRDAIEQGDSMWIVKPSMSDKGQGIGIFKTVQQLQNYFDSFDNDDDDEEEEEEEEEKVEHSDIKNEKESKKNGLILSHLRHFIVQKYISNPWLLPEYGRKKFHLRTYVVAQGDLNVFVYKHILALFADQEYPDATNQEDEEQIEMGGHLTNTCLQAESDILVVPFWKLNGLNQTQKDQIYNQVLEITKEVYQAAASVDKLNFQPLENAVEFFGVDFLVDENLDVYLLEVNSYPDFKQTGEDLKDIITELFDATVKTVIHPMVTNTKINTTSESLCKVL